MKNPMMTTRQWEDVMRRPPQEASHARQLPRPTTRRRQKTVRIPPPQAMH